MMMKKNKEQNIKEPEQPKEKKLKQNKEKKGLPIGKFFKAIGGKIANILKALPGKLKGLKTLPGKLKGMKKSPAPQVAGESPSVKRKPVKLPFAFLNSMKSKIIAVLFVSILLAVIITANVIISYSKTLVVDSAYGKMMNIVTSYGAIVDREEEEKAGDGKPLPKEEYPPLLQDVKMDGMKTATCYLLHTSGIIYYSSDESKIGKPNKVKVITDVITELAKGHRPDNLCMEYEDENNQKRYASFYITKAKCILVMDVTAKELMQPITGLYLRATGIAILILALAMLITLWIVGNITKPIIQITKIINDTARLKLRNPENLDELCELPDETGEISRAVRTMTVNLIDVVSKIDTANKSIEQDMQKLEASSNQVNKFCTDNSATAEELASSTEEMATKLQDIGTHMKEMRTQSQSIGEVTENSNRVSTEIAMRAQNMQSTTLDAIARTKDMYQQLKLKADAAVEGLKSVKKINALTNAISDISDQTSLLSLNASIEAARAGESGRGFAVVASEISNLANKSMENVANIDQIVEEINTVVRNTSAAMEETILFLEQNVLADYDNFNAIGNQYYEDADTFKNTMTQISGQVEELNQVIVQIANNLGEVQNTVSTNSHGVTEIAEKTSDVVVVTTDNCELADSTVRSVDDLKQIVDRFEF